MGEKVKKSLTFSFRDNTTKNFIDKPEINFIIRGMNMKRIVIKIGSAVLNDRRAGINASVLSNIVSNINDLLKHKTEVLIVSSGAVSSGMFMLNRSLPYKSLPEKQAIASIGQILLMQMYADEFKKFDTVTSQVLLTNDILTNRERFVNAKNTLNTLLGWYVVPIINENDTVSVEELRFGDNDRLASLVSILVDAELLLILSNVDGLYSNVEGTGALKKIDYVARIDEQVYSFSRGSSSRFGTGGMLTKIQAAEVATKSGISCIICNGKEPDSIRKAIARKNFGTFFAAASPLSAKKRWLAFSTQSTGKIIIDAGAVQAIKEKGKSVLPVGIKSLDGNFKKNDIIDICSEEGESVAKGISYYSAATLKKIIGKRSNEIKDILGVGRFDEVVVHRDNLVLR